MKTILLRVLAGLILVTFLTLGYSAGAKAATTTKTLDNDTKITPPGVIAIIWIGIPEFKKGTDVVLNQNGEVLEGVLTSYERLRCVPDPFSNQKFPRILSFKPGTKVTFNDKGEVVKGTIGDTVILALSQTNNIAIQSGTEISFHENGMIATCTPGWDIYLKPVGWQKNLSASYTDKLICPGFVEFKSGLPIALNDKGEVTRGTLNKDSKLMSPNGLKVYEAGTMVEFDDNGVVVKASK